MISKELKTKYTPTIGIECHVQLKTKTKLFSAVSNDARGASANTLISHIDLGMPGALPVLNEKALEYAARIAFAFNTKPQAYSFFERKHYFYPDLPKGYQITQLTHPIVKGGHVEIMVNNQPHQVRINRVQMEEDAGKSIHPAGQEYSLVDLNRAGTPLLEIVSEPDMHSAEEAKLYAKELYLIARYTGVSDADLFQGNIRFDVNVSVSPDTNKLGTRTETKNLNSFRSVEKAVDYEIERQIELLEKGSSIVQETRGWDEAKQKTLSQRSKEEAHDYRYFPEPDIPPLDLDESWMEHVADDMPVLPIEWRKRLTKLNLDKPTVDVLLDAEIQDEDVSYLSLFEDRFDDKNAITTPINFMVNVEIPLRAENTDLPKLTNDQRKQIYTKIIDGLMRTDKLSSTSAKSMITNLLKDGHVPLDFEKYAEEQGYIQVSDESAIKAIVEDVLKANPQAAADVKVGEAKAIGFLVGQVMKNSLGKANPQLAQKLIKEILDQS